MQALERILYVTLAVAAALPFLMFIFFKKDEAPTQFQRSIKSVELEVAREIPIEFHAVQISVSNGQLFVYNFEGGQIVQLDSVGKVERVFGQRGDAPGQFQVLSNFYVKNNTLFCLDARNTSFVEFDLEDGKLINYHKVRESFNKGLILDSTRYVISTQEKGSDRTIFKIYSRNGEYITSIEEPYKETGFASDGIFVPSEETFFHICYHISRFVAFGANGNTHFKGTTVENYFDVPPVISDGDAKYLSTKAKTLSYAGCADAAFAYILSAERADNENPADFNSNSPVDIYNSNTGEYLETFYIPTHKGKKVRAIAKHRNGFYTIQGNYILYYEKKS